MKTYPAMKTYAVIRIYDDHKRVIYMDYLMISKEQAEKKAKADCEYLGGVSWEVSTLVQPF